MFSVCVCMYVCVHVDFPVVVFLYQKLWIKLYIHITSDTYWRTCSATSDTGASNKGRDSRTKEGKGSRNDMYAIASLSVDPKSSGGNWNIKQGRNTTGPPRASPRRAHALPLLEQLHGLLYVNGSSTSWLYWHSRFIVHQPQRTSPVTSKVDSLCKWQNFRLSRARDLDLGYCIPSCITLPTNQISLKLKKLFVDGRTDGHLRPT